MRMVTCHIKFGHVKAAKAALAAWQGMQLPPVHVAASNAELGRKRQEVAETERRIQQVRLPVLETLYWTLAAACCHFVQVFREGAPAQVDAWLTLLETDTQRVPLWEVIF